MGSVTALLSFLLVIVSGWIRRHQLLVIEFLDAENQLPKQRLRGKRIRFTDAERALLARKAKAVGRKALLELDNRRFSTLERNEGADSMSDIGPISAFHSGSNR